MAYKSRVTNKRYGATFGGQIRSSDSSSSTELLKTLSAITPTLEKIQGNYIQGKKDVAKEEINKLYLTKTPEQIQKEILNGDHPNLTGKYVDKTVAYHTGRYQAVDTIAKITENIGDYNFKEDNLPAFYKQFLPDMKNAEGSYTLGFAAVFNEYKAKAAIADAKVRSKYAQEEKIKNGAKILSSFSAETFWERKSSLEVDLPAETKNGKKHKLYTTDESNASAYLYLSGAIDTATTSEELYKIEQIIDADRGVGKGGNELGSMRSVKNNPTINGIIQALETKERTLVNAEYTASQRLKDKEKTEYTKKIFAIDRSTTEGAIEYTNLLKEATDKYPELNATINSVAKNKYEVTEDDSGIAQLKISVMKGDYNGSLAALQDEWSTKSNNPETLVKLTDLWLASKKYENSNYTPPFQEPAFTKTASKIQRQIVDAVTGVDKKYNGQKNQFIADLITNDLQEEYMDWLEKNPKPARMENTQVQNEWVKEQTKFFNDSYNEKIKTYSQQNWLNAVAERINKNGLDLTSDIDLDSIAIEYYEEKVSSAVTAFKPFVNELQSESDSNLTNLSDTLMASSDFQNLLKTKGFEGFANDTTKQKALAERMIKDLGLESSDYTDERNKLMDTINSNIQDFVLPLIETYTPLGLIEKGDSKEAQKNFFTDSIEKLAGMPMTKQIYNTILNEDAKANLAKAFNINSLQLDDLINEYLK